jgi:hypothetical protein
MRSLSTTQDVAARADIKARKDLTFSLGDVFEKYHVVDFATDDVETLSGLPARRTNTWVSPSGITRPM